MKQFGWLHLILALAVGLAAGVAIGLHMPRWAFMHMHRGGNPTARMVEKFSRDLKLDAAQREKLTAILERTHKRVMDLRKGVGPRFEAIRRETSAEIAKILTPEQAARFREMEKKWDARHRGRKPGEEMGPGPGAPPR